MVRTFTKVSYGDKATTKKIDMQRILYLILFFIISTTSLYAQKTVPLEKRNVSGVLRDSLNKPIAGATVSLSSKHDTLQTATNTFGFWGFKEVKSAEFLLTVNALGYKAYIRQYFNNDTKAQLNIPPIRLGVHSEELSDVVIERLKGPTTRGDTTEFWAKDYIVRDYGRLEDLLRRLEGVTIDPDGSVFYNGERVVKALFNNSTYFQGSVQEAMKELPADIVERIQIIDRNEEGTGSKGLKSDNTSKVLNIVTKADKSAGRMYDISLQQGTQSRSHLDGYMRWIDGPDQTSVSAGYKQVPEGIQSSITPGSIGQAVSMRGIVIMEGGNNVTDGLRKQTSASFGRNIKSDNFNMYPQYDFNFNDQWSNTERLSGKYYEEGDLTEISNDYRNGKEQKHGIASMYTLKGKGFGQVQGNISLGYTKYDNSSQRTTDRRGIINNLEQDGSTKKGNKLSYNLTTDYRKSLGEKWSLGISGFSSYSGDSGDEDLLTEVFSQNDPTLPADSTIHQLRRAKNNSLRNTLHNRLTYSGSDRLKIEYALGLTSNNSLRDLQSSLQEGGMSTYQPDLSNYQRTNTFSVPLSIRPEYTFSNGVYLAPSFEVNNSWLAGQLNPGTPSIDRFDALLRPRMSIGYTNKNLGAMTIGYGQSYQQPNIAQLNPDVYYNTPYDVQIGNPDLKNTRTNSIDVRYSHFFRKIAVNLSVMTGFTTIDRLVTSDRTIEIDPEKNIITTNTRYLNVDGGQRQNYNFSLSKTLSRLNSSLSYTGSIITNKIPYFANGKQELQNSFRQQHKVSFFYSPARWMELTPEIQYQATEDKNSLATFSGKTYNRMLSTDLKAGFYLPKDFRINMNLSQSAYETTNIMSNKSPFVVNANIEKRFFKEKNGILSFVVMDLTRQNAFTNYSSNELGYTNTLTNLDSRYFLLQFSWRPQVWSKSKHDTGQGRRGDGSFIGK